MNKEEQVLLDAVREAGAAIAALQKTGFAVERKSNNDLVTQADLLANDMITKAIAKHFPHDGWLSEELADNPVRRHCKRVWVIDPIDGTIEYTKGLAEYAISVALVEEGVPILAVVFNPETNELFHAVKGRGAWLNQQRIVCDDMPTEKFVLLASRSEYKRGEWERFEQAHSVKPVGSIAYKLALVAAGKAHATFSLGPKNEWDIAAGVLLVIEAGGKATDKQGIIFYSIKKTC